MCYCDSLTLSHRKLTPFVWDRNNILRIRPFPPKSFVCVNLFQYIKIYFFRMCLCTAVYSFWEEKEMEWETLTTQAYKHCGTYLRF